MKMKAWDESDAAFDAYIALMTDVTGAWHIKMAEDPVWAALGADYMVYYKNGEEWSI